MKYQSMKSRKAPQSGSKPAGVLFLATSTTD